MNDFFFLLLDKIEILTGIRQLERLQNKPAQLAELVDECVKAAGYYPIKEEITKSVLMDAVSNDPDFIGLNVKWVRKTLNLYCQVHGLTKENQKEEKVDLVKAYTNYISFWNERPDLDPLGERVKFAVENLDRVTKGEPPIDDTEAIKIMGGIYQEQIKNTFIETIDNPKHSGSRLKDHFETYAPKPNDTLNEKGSEGTGETSGLSDDKNNQEQSNESSQEKNRAYFCLKTNICKLQCDRCRAEEEITKANN